MKAYFKLRHEITVSNENNVFLKGTRIILPASLRSRALSLAHEGHQGLVKTKRLLREKVWFPGIDAKAKLMIEECLPCQTATPTTHHEPLQMTTLPSGPWQKLAADFCGPFPTGEYILVVIDEFSRYPEVEVLKSTSAKATIPKMDKILSTHGIPTEIKTDNGPPFNSQEFQDFADDLGFKHRKITPLWPQANAEAERFMRTLKKTIITAHTDQLNWKQQMYRFLRNYRATPHITTDKTPSELLFGRKMKTKLPEITPTVNDSDLRNKDSNAKDSDWRCCTGTTTKTQQVFIIPQSTTIPYRDNQRQHDHSRKRQTQDYQKLNALQENTPNTFQ